MVNRDPLHTGHVSILRLLASIQRKNALRTQTITFAGAEAAGRVLKKHPCQLYEIGFFEPRPWNRIPGENEIAI